MRKKFLKAMTQIINITFSLFIVSNFILNYIPYNNYRYGFVVGIWVGWNITRDYYNYYKNK